MTGHEREYAKYKEMLARIQQEKLMSSHTSDHAEVEKLMAANAPKAFDRAGAAAAGFNWLTLLSLVLKYGPQIFQIIMDIINGMPKAELLAKYGEGMHRAIDDALSHHKPK